MSDEDRRDGIVGYDVQNRLREKDQDGWEMYRT